MPPAGGYPGLLPDGESRGAVLQDDGVTEAFCAPLRKTEENALYEAWSGGFSFETAGLYFYYFFITTQNEAFRLMKQGNDTNIEAGDLWQVSCVEERYPCAEVRKGRSHVSDFFPDRFYQAGSCDCKRNSNPIGCMKTSMICPCICRMRTARSGTTTLRRESCRHPRKAFLFAGARRGAFVSEPDILCVFDAPVRHVRLWAHRPDAGDGGRFPGAV